MPVPIYVGNCNWSATSIEQIPSRSGPDSLEVRLRGRSDQLQTELNKWTIGRTYPGFGNMYLDTVRAVDASPMSEISLSFRGYLSSQLPENGLVDKQSGVSLQSVALASTEGAAVNVSYYGSTSTFRWKAVGSEPGTPRFTAIVPRSLPVELLFNLSPPEFDGSLAGQYQVAARLTQFDVTRVSVGVWAVSESYTVMIEPTT